MHNPQAVARGEPQDGTAPEGPDLFWQKTEFLSKLNQYLCARR
jgi:hypothetical protein